MNMGSIFGILGRSVKSTVRTENSETLKKALEKDILEIERFTKNDLPAIVQSTNDALSVMEQNAKAIKALMMSSQKK